MDHIEQNTDSHTGPTPAALVLLCLVGGALSSLCVVSAMGVIGILSLAAGSAFVAYAALSTGSVWPLFSPIAFYAVSLIWTRDPLLCLPVMFSAAGAAILFLVCRRAFTRTRAVVTLGMVWCICFGIWILLILYAAYGSLSADSIRQFGQEVHRQFLTVLNQSMVDSSYQAALWEYFKMLIPSLAVVSLLCYAWLACAFLSIPARMFGRAVTPQMPWRTAISPVTAVLFIVGALISVLSEDVGVISCTAENLTLILLPACAAVGFNQIRPQKKGSVRIFSPLLLLLVFVMLFFNFMIAVVLAAFWGAVATLISAWKFRRAGKPD